MIFLKTQIDQNWSLDRHLISNHGRTGSDALPEGSCWKRLCPGDPTHPNNPSNPKRNAKLFWIGTVLDRFFLELNLIKSASVSVAKLNPPIGGNVQEVVIILSKER